MRPTGESPGDVAEALLGVLHGIHRLMRGPLPGADPEAAPFPEKPGQFKLVWILHKRGSLAMQELAASLDVAPPTVTGLVKRLLEQGYVQRVRDESDWRTVRVELTEEGRKALIRHHHERVAALRARIDQLDEDERTKLNAAIPVLARLVEMHDVVPSHPVHATPVDKGLVESHDQEVGEGERLG